MMIILMHEFIVQNTVRTIVAEQSNKMWLTAINGANRWLQSTNSKNA